MGYLHIENLYQNQDILLFRECYALEKIHGTSAHVRWSTDQGVGFHAGGADQGNFEALFDAEHLARMFSEKIGEGPVVVYGEAYGGKLQRMSETYGKDMKFIAFDVKIGDCWLAVPNAEDVCGKLGLQFIPYNRVAADVPTLDAQRDLPSMQSVRNSVEGEHMREGVVLRPLVEVTKNNGARIISKHKRAEFAERKSVPEIDPAKREVLEQADAVAEEWVTPMRLTHVLDKLPDLDGMKSVPVVIRAMVEDVTREAAGEIVDSKDVRKAIGKKAVSLYKQRVMAVLNVDKPTGNKEE